MNSHESVDHLQTSLLTKDEQSRRLDRVFAGMRSANISAAVIRDNANIYYLTGRVFRGYVYLEIDAAPIYFVRQPSTLRCHNAEQLHFIRKPEEMASTLAALGRTAHPIAIELDSISYSDATRLAKAFGADSPCANISPIMRAARAVKTEHEQNMLIASGKKHSLVYERIPRLFREGMSDIELQIEIERLSRLEGCLGQFRISGGDMELFMGNVLTGDNGDTPSPYDFAMGGAGLDPSLPVGANGTVIKPGLPVMIDVNGNYTGYMTDMTRCFYSTRLEPEAQKALVLSQNICSTLADMMRPGAEAKDLYIKAKEMSDSAGMGDYFMGHRSHAGFVGHGIGIEINEMPVIAPRSRDILQAGNVIALEPKFVIPGIGAIGIENSYIVQTDGPALCITTATEDAVRLD